MADLEGKTIASTYRSILNVGTADNAELHATTLKIIEDGAGNDSPLYLAQQKVKIHSATDSTTMFQILDADGGTPILNVDSINEKVGIGTDSPATHLEISNAGGANLMLTREDGDIQADEVIGTIYFAGADPSGEHTGAMIKALCDRSAWTTDAENKSTSLGFYTQDDNDSDKLGSPRLFIDRDGMVCINNTSADGLLTIKAATDSDDMLRLQNTDGEAIAHMYSDSKNGVLLISADGAVAKAQIHSNGVSYFNGGNVGINDDSPDNRLDVVDGTDGAFVVRVEHTDADNPNGIQVTYSGGAPNTADVDLFFKGEDTGATRFRVAGNGDVETVTGTDIAAISDERMKENIADYTGGLAIVNALKPRTFTWKPDVDRGLTGTRYGFIAQEMQAISDIKDNMGLVRSGKIDDDDMSDEN